MSESLPNKPEVSIEGKNYVLEIGRCAVFLFRKKSEVDHLKIYQEDDNHVRGFNAPDLVHWIAGYRIRTDEEGEIVRDTTLYEDKTFRGVYGWGPMVIEREEPSVEEEEAWLDVSTAGLDEEWGKGL